MPMNKHNKVLVLIFIVFLLTSLTVRSETAPNLLELTEGISVSGDLNQYEISGTMEFGIDKIWYDPFTDENLVEMIRNMTDTPPNPPYYVKRQIVTSLIMEDNRTVLLPASRFYTETVEDAVLFFLNITDSMDIAEEDLIVTYHGVNYTLIDIDTESELYSNISIWYLSFVLGNAFELQLMPLTRYAISPQATIGQEIDYGTYTGEVMGFKEYEISETEKYEVIEVHHEEAVIMVDISGLGSPEPYTIGETTFFYEKQTGIVLHWIEYNSTADLYYYFNATKVVGIIPLISEYSVPSLVLLSTILIATPIIMSRKRKK
ncbi:MAG: hypothetical protein HGN29_15875 [Asgard group archaeon]|nr:hypothetical protein [Asgard group archaeon]